MKIDKKWRYKSGIYKISNLINNKFYIGQAMDLYNRLHGHINKLKNNKHHNNHLQFSFNKYGKNNFIFEIIEYVNIDLLTEKEQYYVDILKPEYNKNLVIIDPFIRVFSDKDKALASKLMKDYYKNGGKKTTKIILVYNLNGDFIKEYESITLFANENCVLPGKLSKMIKSSVSKFRTFQIKFKDDDNKIIDVYRNPRIKQKARKILMTSEERSLNSIKSFKNSSNSKYKLSFDDIDKIKQLNKEGMKQKDISIIFNIDQSCISRIVNNVKRKERSSHSK